MGALRRVLASLFLAVAGSAHAGEPVKIRIGWVVPITDWALFMVEKRDLMRHAGKTYVLEPVRFASSPTGITAMAGNDLDIGNLAFSTFALAIENAGLHDLRVVSDLFQDGVAGITATSFWSGATARSPTWKISKARSLPRRAPAVRSTSPCASCCVGTVSRTSETTP